MTTGPARLGRAARVTIALGLGAGLAACASPGSGAGSATGAPALTVPLDTTLPVPGGTVAVVAMGTLRQPLNTFWQIFTRPTASTRWTLVTPPGVADNGGLVVGSGPTPSAGGDGVLVAGFEPSQDLLFSPLAQSVDLGRSWGPGLVPTALADVPDALALAPGGAALALVRAKGGEVLRSSGAGSRWTALVRRSRLAAAPAARSCGVGALTAVAFDAAGDPLVGTTCSVPGALGVFRYTRGGWEGAGPLPRAGSASSVLRLATVGGVTEALAAVRRGGRVGVVVATRTQTGSWSSSAVLALPGGSRLASTGLDDRGGFAVVSATATRRALDVENGPAEPWRALPAPPPGTEAVAVDGGAVDALTVASTRFADWRLRANGRWAKLATVLVPIPFGSSS